MAADVTVFFLFFFHAAWLCPFLVRRISPSTVCRRKTHNSTYNTIKMCVCCSLVVLYISSISMACHYTQWPGETDNCFMNLFVVPSLKTTSFFLCVCVFFTCSWSVLRPRRDRPQRECPHAHLRPLSLYLSPTSRRWTGVQNCTESHAVGLWVCERVCAHACVRVYACNHVKTL